MPPSLVNVVVSLKTFGPKRVCSVPLKLLPAAFVVPVKRNVIDGYTDPVWSK